MYVLLGSSFKKGLVSSILYILSKSKSVSADLRELIPLSTCVATSLPPSTRSKTQRSECFFIMFNTNPRDAGNKCSFFFNSSKSQFFSWIHNSHKFWLFFHRCLVLASEVQQKLTETGLHELQKQTQSLVFMSGNCADRSDLGHRDVRGPLLFSMMADKDVLILVTVRRPNLRSFIIDAASALLWSFWTTSICCASVKRVILILQIDLPIIKIIETSAFLWRSWDPQVSTWECTKEKKTSQPPAAVSVDVDLKVKI